MRAGVGTRSEHVRRARCVRAWKPSGRGGPVRACVHGPVRACVCGDPACERAWGPGASMRAWKPSGCGGPVRASVHGPVRACVHGDPTSERAWGPGACVHRDQAGVGTRCERVRWALRASGRGDPVRACEMGPASKRARGPGASVRDGPCERAGMGTWCKQACVGPVHVCVGPVRAWIQQAWTRACRDPARTASSSTRMPVSIQHVKK